MRTRELNDRHRAMAELDGVPPESVAFIINNTDAVVSAIKSDPRTAAAAMNAVRYAGVDPTAAAHCAEIPERVQIRSVRHPIGDRWDPDPKYPPTGVRDRWTLPVDETQ